MADRQSWERVLLQKNREINILLTRINDLEEEAAALDQRIAMEENRAEQMREVLDEYERVISRLYAEKTQVNDLVAQKVDAITRERDEQVEHLRIQERIFAEFHEKFEKCKEAVTKLRENEAALLGSLEEHRQAMVQKDQQYSQLKNSVAQSLENANQELDAVMKSQAAEVARAQAQLHRVELQLQEAQLSLQVKERENQELTNILDELIEQTGVALQ